MKTKIKRNLRVQGNETGARIHKRSSVQFGVILTSAAPGSAQGLLLIVSDIEAARQQLVARSVDASEVFHCATGTGCRFPNIDVRVSGPHPEHLSYGSFVSFKDPAGNGCCCGKSRRGFLSAFQATRHMCRCATLPRR